MDEEDNGKSGKKKGSQQKPATVKAEQPKVA